MSSNEPKQQWRSIGKGNYNDVYRSADGKRVLKIQQNESNTDTP